MSIGAVEFDYIRKLVRERSAIVLEPGKEYLAESRLMPLAREAGCESLEALVAKMLEKRPAARPESMARVLEVLATVPRTLTRRRRFTLAAALVAGSVVVLGTGLTFVRRPTVSVNIEPSEQPSVDAGVAAQTLPVPPPIAIAPPEPDAGVEPFDAGVIAKPSYVRRP